MWHIFRHMYILTSALTFALANLICHNAPDIYSERCYANPAGSLACCTPKCATSCPTGLVWAMRPGGAHRSLGDWHREDRKAWYRVKVRWGNAVQSLPGVGLRSGGATLTASQLEFIARNINVKCMVHLCLLDLILVAKTSPKCPILRLSYAFLGSCEFQLSPQLRSGAQRPLGPCAACLLLQLHDCHLHGWPPSSPP